MSGALEIRTFKSDDRPELIALWQECGLIRERNDPNDDIDSKLQHDAEGLLIAASGTAIIGSVMVGYDGHRGWINYLAVSPAHQRRGIGARLMEVAERHLRDRGCPKVNLQVRSTNRGVLDFYRRLGFTQDDVVSMGKRFDL